MKRTADVVIIGGGVTGCSIAVGMSGHGFKLSPAVGHMMAELIASGIPTLTDPSAFRLDRFARQVHEDAGAFSHSYLR